MVKPETTVLETYSSKNQCKDLFYWCTLVCSYKESSPKFGCDFLVILNGKLIKTVFPLLEKHFQNEKTACIVGCFDKVVLADLL